MNWSGNWRFGLAIWFAAFGVALAQDPKSTAPPPPPAATSSPAPPPPQQSNGQPEVYATKTFDLRYVDPEQIRRVFSGQSHVIDANRELKLLTARGSAAFLKEVEDTIRRLDVPPPLPPNAQVTVYLIAAAAQAPSGVALPAELKALEKELPGKLADLQMLRVRVGQSGEAINTDVAPAAPAVSLARIRVDSSSVSQGAKGDVVSLNGLKIWINIPLADPTAPGAKTAKAEPDVTADIDLIPNEAAVVAKIGVEKPLAVVVRVVVVRTP